MPTLELTDCGFIYRNPYPGHQSIHGFLPFVVELAPQEFFCVYRRGTAFYSPDGSLARARSTDGGVTWKDEGPVWDASAEDTPYRYTGPFVGKLKNGSLVLVAFRAVRSASGQLMVNQTTGGFIKAEEIFSVSSDGGRTWSVPEAVRLPGDPIVYCSGPVVELNDGTWFLPFDLGKAYDDPNPLKPTMVGYFSRDRGRTWGDQTTLAEGAIEKGFWHGRVVKLLDGRLFTLLWTGSQATSNFVDLHRTVSDVNGRDWSTPEPTGIPGQTSYVVDLGGGRMVAAYTYRGADKPGIKAVVSLDGGKTWDLDNQVQLWDATGRETIGVASQNTYPQSHDTIAFGRPQAIPTSDGDVMASYWGTASCLTQAFWARLRVVG